MQSQGTEVDAFQILQTVFSEKLQEQDIAYHAALFYL